MGNQRSPETILRDIAAIGVMERGTLSEMRRPGGSVYYNLQVWTAGRNRCEYVPAKELEALQEAVANYARFRELVEEYVQVVEQTSRQVRRGADRSEKKGSANRPRRQPAGR